MLDIVGYCDRLSLRAGETLKVMVSCEGGASSYRADLVRLICGDVSSAGPGYKEEEVANPANGTYPGRRQRIFAGSYIHVPRHSALDGIESFTVEALVWPTMPEQEGRVILGRWNAERSAGYLLMQGGAHGAVLLVADGKSRQEVAIWKPMTEREWYRLTASFDAASGLLRVEQKPLARYARDESAGAAERRTGLPIVTRVIAATA